MLTLKARAVSLGGPGAEEHLHVIKCICFLISAYQIPARPLPQGQVETSSPLFRLLFFHSFIYSLNKNLISTRHQADLGATAVNETDKGST